MFVVAVSFIQIGVNHSIANAAIVVAFAVVFDFYVYEQALNGNTTWRACKVIPFILSRRGSAYIESDHDHERGSHWIS